MSKKYRKLLPVAAFALASAVAVAAVEPKNVVIFFLPVQNTAEINSLQEAVPTPLPADGVSAGVRAPEIGKKDANQEKHGIPTPAGVSLLDKGNVTVEQAAQNILLPARVLILPQQRGKGAQTDGKDVPMPKPVAGLPESVTADKVRVFPLKNPVKAIAREQRERPVVAPYRPVKPPVDQNDKRPRDMEKWTGWILDQLENCSMDANVVLPTAYWMTANGKLTDGTTDCDMKSAVAGYLRQCHPWPAAYYTPVNNDVKVRSAVQLSVEYLETVFNTKKCPSLNLAGVNFDKVDFIKGELGNTDFTGSYFHEATFSEVNLSDSNFGRADMENAYFQGTRLNGALFFKAQMKDTHFYQVEAEAAGFDGADLQNAQFRDVNLTQAVFNDAVLQNTHWMDIRGGRVRANGANFSNAEFDNVLFNQIQARKTVFNKVSCNECMFKRGDFKEAYFYDAKFRNTVFDRSYIEGAHMRAAKFLKNVSFHDVSRYRADFGGADMGALENVQPEEMAQVKIDRETVLPDGLSEYETDSFDIELENPVPVESVDRYSCSHRTCEDRLLGRTGNQNLAVRAMTILENPESDLDAQGWALCTMGCIAQKDKKLSDSQIDILAAFIKRNRPWNAETDLFKPYSPVTPEVQMALFVLTDMKLKRDRNRLIDLTGTDLRAADLSRSNLLGIDFSGSNLSGADLHNSLADRTYALFDQILIDEFTRFPYKIRLFKPFTLPTPVWKPKKVRIYRDGWNPWTLQTEEIPYSEKLELKPEKKPEDKK